MADQDLTMKALDVLTEALNELRVIEGLKPQELVVNPPSGPAKDWNFDSDAVVKDQKGDCVVSLKDLP